jgi:beta-glucosidase
LSYTTFEFGKAKADKTTMSQNDKITFTVSVKNTGKKAGAEVAQLYISDLKSSVESPAKELKGFEKVSESGEEKK